MELLIVLAIVLVLFGAGRLPKIAKSMREARDEFEKGKAEDAANAAAATQAAAAAPGIVTARACPKCGALSPAEAAFCMKCATPLA